MSQPLVPLSLLTHADFSTYGSAVNVLGVASSRDGTTMYACIAGGGVIKSTNSGTTWNPTNATNPGFYTSIACDSTGQIVYVVWLGAGLYGSTNGGASWSVVISGGTLPGGPANPETASPFGGYSFDNVDQ